MDRGSVVTDLLVKEYSYSCSGSGDVDGFARGTGEGSEQFSAQGRLFGCIVWRLFSFKIDNLLFNLSG